jgi:tetratricopeptide (TPR) repeat protein
MAGKIFINYRREDSAGTAGRLHDRLAQAFGRKNLFMDVDHVPAGVDFVEYLHTQVAACDVFLAVIGPNWLDAKDDEGRRRFDRPGEDFVTIEIAAALARKIRVIPVLVDGARIPKADKLPRLLKPLVRRNAVEIRNTQFGRDAEALIGKIREGLGANAISVNRWRTAAGAIAALLLLGWIGLFAAGMPLLLPGTVQPDTREQAEQHREVAAKAEEERKAKAAAEAEARAKAEQAEKERLAAAKAEEERQAKAAAEAEARAKAEQAEKERLAAAKAEEERQAKAAAEAEARVKAEQAEKWRLAAAKAEEERRKQAETEGRARLSALISQSSTDINNRDYDAAITALSEAIRLDPKNARVFLSRGVAYERKGDADRAVADYSDAIRLDPKNALALLNRGIAYGKKGDADRAIADFNEAIRLDPKNVIAFNNRGFAYWKKGDADRAIADYNEAIRSDASSGFAFFNRARAYQSKGNNDRAITDYTEAIRLNHDSANAFNNRGNAYAAKGDNNRAIADYNEAIRLDPKSAVFFCNRGRLKLKIKDANGNSDIGQARLLDVSSCR